MTILYGLSEAEELVISIQSMLMSSMILWESTEVIGSRRNEPTINDVKKEDFVCDCEKTSKDLQWRLW